MLIFVLACGEVALAQAPDPSSPASAANQSAAADPSLCKGQTGLGGLNRYPETFTFKLENDLFAGTDTDYTNGIKLSWVSANVQDYSHDPCLPRWVRDINRALEFVDRGNYVSRNMSISLGQAMFTPTNRYLNPPDPKDRPYAAWLYLGLGYNARGEDFMRTYELDIGAIGPAALGRESQDLIHDARGIPRFEGWDHQLGNELGVQLIAERKDKWVFGPGSSGLSMDVIGHYGASVGNVASYLNAGAEVRIGYFLPDDFGTSAIRPGGDNAAPFLPNDRGGRRGTGLHVFASFDGRAIARNIFLDGNTLHDSPHVDKKILVADSAIGIAWLWQSGKIAYAHYLRTKEFNGQSQPQAYGSITLSLNF